MSHIASRTGLKSGMKILRCFARLEAQWVSGASPRLLYTNLPSVGSGVNIVVATFASHNIT